MATKKTPVKSAVKNTKRVAGTKTIARSREQVMAEVCAELSAGASLESACRKIADAPHPSNILRWVEGDPVLAQDYAQARARGYSLLADQIVAISDETSTEIEVQETDPDGNLVFNADGTPALKSVRIPLSAEVIARNRLRVDTRKWMLSKMLPKVYGERVETVHSGSMEITQPIDQVKIELAALLKIRG